MLVSRTLLTAAEISAFARSSAPGSSVASRAARPRRSSITARARSSSAICDMSATSSVRSSEPLAMMPVPLPRSFPSRSVISGMTRSIGSIRLYEDASGSSESFDWSPRSPMKVSIPSIIAVWVRKLSPWANVSPSLRSRVHCCASVAQVWSSPKPLPGPASARSNSVIAESSAAAFVATAGRSASLPPSSPDERPRCCCIRVSTFIAGASTSTPLSSDSTKCTSL